MSEEQEVPMLLSLVSLAWAADPPEAEDIVIGDERPIEYLKRTELIFHEALGIEGELLRPLVDIHVETKRPKFPPAIPLRTEWKQELRWSINDVK